MRWWEILLIIQGYRRRNVLIYQLQRITAWASAFCMGNPKNKAPEDLFHLYCDDYITEDDEPLMSIEEQKEWQAEMAAINASLNK